MKAAVVKEPSHVEVREISNPSVGPGEILVKMQS